VDDTQPIAAAGDPVAVWTRILDRIEAGLAQQPPSREALPTDGAVCAMPVSLRLRAERVLAAQRQLEAELAARRDEVAEELRALAPGRAPRNPTPAAPSTLDELA
jgi:hypothetical protein